jgi:hypothetical protein
VKHSTFLDEPPAGDALTPYDREHLKIYLRLLDAEADGAGWTEIVALLFGLDPSKEPERAKRVYSSHMARARWIADQGYTELVRSAYH